MDLAQIGAAALRAKLGKGECSAVEVAEAFLAAIERQEEAVRAWAFLDPDLVRQQARQLDGHRHAGRALGSLHGVPVGIKDIIDVAHMPTENGTVLDAGRRTARSAFVVSKLAEAGALILGKTATTELAYYSPARTLNPHNREHTPGGSSAGSAASVAARMAPLAVGTQTNGSVIRPASFCGVFGYKPTHGLISRSGILRQSPPLDTVGFFANSLADLALIGDAAQGFDAEDRDMRPIAPLRLSDFVSAPPPVRPAVAFVKTPAWEKATDDVRDGFAELVQSLGEACDEVELPDTFANGYGAVRNLMTVGFAHNLGHYYRRGRDQLSSHMREAIEEGQRVPATDWLAALEWREVLHAGLEQVFRRYNAIITPAAPGEAPEGLASTGDPSFCTLWTFLGVPAVTLPLLMGSRGLPIGVQIVGPRLDDARLFRTASWLVAAVNDGAGEQGGELA